VLYQQFTIPIQAASAILSFDMFVKDWAQGAVVDPTGLDHTTGGILMPKPNQHARVDILLGGSVAYDTSPGAVQQKLLPRCDVNLHH